MKRAKKLLTHRQLKRLMESFCKTRGVDRATDVEIQCIVSWAEDTIMRGQLLRLVFDGKLDIDWKDDDPTFCDMGA